mgnify:CR=1 FL=1
MTERPFTRLRRTTTLLLAGAVCVACAPGTAAPPSPAPNPVAVVRTGDSTYIARAQADSAKLPYTQADIDFMTHMISHHAQAIDMSNWAPTHGASPEVQRLAARIINAQPMRPGSATAAPTVAAAMPDRVAVT